MPPIPQSRTLPLHCSHGTPSGGPSHATTNVRRGVWLARASATAALAAAVGGCLDPETRKQMAESDSLLGPLMRQPSPADAAAWASDEYDADKRARGTSLLIAAPFGGEEPYLALYRKYVKDESTNVRAIAVRGLGLHGNPEDVPLMTPLLSEKERTVRLEAAHALQRVHNPVAIEPLVERLDPAKEAEPAVRAECAIALAQYATNRSLQALISALADDSLAVTYNAHRSLVTLTGQDQLTDDRREWATWAADTKDPFAQRRAFVYPIFERDDRWIDYVPFITRAPNEQPASPAGMPEVSSPAPSPTSPTPPTPSAAAEPTGN